jgi:predicted transposase YdaD
MRESVIYQKILKEGREEGLNRERSLILRQLNRRVGELPQDISDRVKTLSLEQLENLGEALLDFTTIDDLQAWLEGLF